MKEKNNDNAMPIFFINLLLILKINPSDFIQTIINMLGSTLL